MKLSMEAVRKGNRSYSDEYTVKRTGTNGAEWTCSVRNKNVHCRATVRQSGDTFSRGPQPYIHVHMIRSWVLISGIQTICGQSECGQ